VPRATELQRRAARDDKFAQVLTGKRAQAHCRLASSLEQTSGAGRMKDARCLIEERFQSFACDGRRPVKHFGRLLGAH
jgi:hypothetical protein